MPGWKYLAAEWLVVRRHPEDGGVNGVLVVKEVARADFGSGKKWGEAFVETAGVLNADLEVDRRGMSLTGWQGLQGMACVQN